MQYQVRISTWKRGGQPEFKVVKGCSLTKAWRLCRRASRRGFKRFGGEIKQGNWGTHGGQFPWSYTSAVIETMH